MRVFLTGASGFVGSHTVRALVDAGHTVRALVRNPDKARAVLARLDVPPGEVELVRGDMIDACVVGEALTGCDAVIHAAAAIGVTRPGHGRRPKGDPESDLVHVNVSGTRNVIGGAVGLGIDRIVHVSTIGVFVPPPGPVITADGPLATPRTDYGRSKVAAERYVRDLQAEGAPVTIVYPGGVCGPDQPVLDSLMEGLARALDLAFPLPPGGASIIDVRDVAQALLRAVDPPGAAAGPVPDRLVLGGHYLTWRQYAAMCDRLTGVRSRSFPVPGLVMLAAGSLLDAAKRVRGFDYPLTRDAAEFMVRLVPTDDAPALEALSLTLRPAEETLEDGLRWLAGNGHLRRAGKLAPPGRRRRTLLQRTAGPLFVRISGARWFAKVGPKLVPPVDRLLHRASGGRFLIGQALVPSLVLTTTGAASGLPRSVPLACMPEPGGRGWIVVGSNFGRERHPAWTGNLLKHPDAEVSFRGRTVPVTARLLDDRERDEIWPRLRQVWPVYDRYRERTERELRVFRLTPRE